MPSKDDYNGNENENENENENKNKYEKKNDNENEHDNDNENENDNDNKNENENENENDNENEHDNDNQNDNGSDNKNESENENENDNYNYNKTKELNDSLDKMIDQSKSFEEQIKLFKKVKTLDEYWHCRYFGGKELKLKIFKANLANCSNFIDEKLFAKIFGYTLVTLANKLINTTNKEENQIIVNDIKKNKDKLYEKDKTHPLNDYVIQPNDRRIDLIDAVNLILDFNETIQLDLV